VSATLAIVAAALGVVLGAHLARRNERAGSSDRLLAEALDEVVSSIADVASGQGASARAQYASAVSRIALHASPAVVHSFRCFQDHATTYTQEGRERLLEALQLARRDLGHEPAASDDLRALRFGADGTRLPPEPDARL
jgi:ElaB/YqjD/DUF883 family membrane-anchored ribosome-binding protein